MTEVPAKPNRKDLFKELLRQTIKARGTDLYLVIGAAPLVRVAGQLMPLIEQKITPEILHDLLSSVASPNILKVVEREGACNFATSIPGVARFRINLYKQRGSYCLVAHYIPSRIPSFDDYEIPNAVRNFSDVIRGLVVISGEGGSGRSTTTAALINAIRNKRRVKIITLEDPIEFIYRHEKSIVCQREYGTDFSDWESALRNTLKQSPDIVMIGEIDSQIKLNVAIKICAAGRMCIGSVVASNAIKVIEALESLAGDEVSRHSFFQQIAMAISGISCQKLVQATAGHSVAAFEVVYSNQFVTSLIRAEGDYVHLRDYIQKEGDDNMFTIDKYLFDLFIKGNITENEALLHTESPDEFKALMRQMNEGKSGDPVGDTIGGGDDEHLTLESI